MTGRSGWTREATHPGRQRAGRSGDELTGRVVALEGGQARSLTLGVGFVEQSPDDRVAVLDVRGVIHEGDLASGDEVAFRYLLPEWAFPSVGRHDIASSSGNSTSSWIGKGRTWSSAGGSRSERGAIESRDVAELRARRAEVARLVEPAPAAGVLCTAARDRRRGGDNQPRPVATVVDERDTRRLEQLAQLAVGAGANVAEGQLVELIASSIEHAPLVRAVARAAYGAGARYVEFRYADPHVRKAMIELADEEVLTWSPPWVVERVKALGEAQSAQIAIVGEPEPELLADLDQARVGKARPIEAVKTYLGFVSRSEVSWTMVPYPNEGWARTVFSEPDVERLWEARVRAAVGRGGRPQRGTPGSTSSSAVPSS